MVYFIQPVDGGPIKIGTTIRLSERLKTLAKEAGQELRVLAVTEGSFDIEKSLHRRFAHRRIVNEWFEPGDDLLGFIVETGQEWDGTDEAPLSDTSVKIDRTVVGKAKLVASHRGVTIAELLTEIIRGPLDKMYAQMLRDLEGKL